jgi:hypothetical protein
VWPQASRKLCPEPTLCWQDTAVDSSLLSMVPGSNPNSPQGPMRPCLPLQFQLGPLSLLLRTLSAMHPFLLYLILRDPALSVL